MCIKSDIMKYESDIWKSCDILRGVGIKQSHWPDYMMPFFALVMMESRLVREKTRLLEEEGYLIEDVVDELQELNKGYNEQVVVDNLTIANLVTTDSNFTRRFQEWLNAWDEETKQLLGIEQYEDQTFMDIQKYIKSLSGKKVLFGYIVAWSVVDLKDYDNSDITTLEEHIKRRWADISAETSGEQYTPDDIFELSSSLIKANLSSRPNPHHVSIYDMTCGGGNMLFGVEDKLRKDGAKYGISTYGQELSEQLYALAKIESRFRIDSQIAYGNTLTDDKFPTDEFDFIVANPPYGVDWKEHKDIINHDETGRYINTEVSVSDGQLMFMQHAIAKLNDNGFGVVVHNGSPMFSGDVNSGESKVRKWLLDNDYVEAWIQLPKEEFFNTQITTYLWVLNKNKAPERKDKILLINASNKFSKLKKSKGKKTNFMDTEHRRWVTEVFNNFGSDDSDDVKVLSKYDFYYNKQKLTLIPENEHGTLYDRLPEKTVNGEVSKAKSIVVNVRKGASEVVLEDIGLNNRATLTIEDCYLTRLVLEKDHAEAIHVFDSGDGVDRFDPKKADAEDEERALTVKEVMAMFASNATSTVTVGNERWSSLVNDHISSVTHNGKPMGCGELKVKVSWDMKAGGVKVAVEAVPVLDKDYEIIPYRPSLDENDAEIQAFLSKWVRKRYILEDNNVGVEVNFNKVFYKPVVLRSTAEIAADIRAVDGELDALEKELWG